MTAPLTGFEARGDLTALVEEVAFLDAVATDTAATVEVLGQSVQGRSIHAAAIGTGRDTLMVTTLIHAAEVATREAALAWFRDLAYSTDPDDLAYLAAHRVVLLTPCNPDGFPGGRMNANGVNLNRDMLALTQPESQAIAAAIRTYRPQMIHDAHERAEVSPGSQDMQYGRGALPEHGAQIASLGGSFLASLGATLTSQGYTHAPYPWGGLGAAQGALSVMGCGLHAVSILTETWMSQTLAQRVARTRAALDHSRAWHADNATALRDAQYASQVEAANKRGRVQVCTQPETVLGGPLVSVAGYNLDAPLPELHRSTFQIRTEGTHVPINQPARWVLPHLLDPESSDAVVAASRVDGPDRYRGVPLAYLTSEGRVSAMRFRDTDGVYDVDMPRTPVQ